MKYFTLQECIYSATAAARKIDNTPTPEIEAHIVESIETLIDPLREAWEAHCRQNGLGKVGINISSGYRGPALNQAVGGSDTSAHCHGYAFDLVPVNGQLRAFKRFCRDFLAGRAFDQLISEGEDSRGVPSWMHVGYKHPDGKQQRRQCYSMIHGKYYPMTD
ncbi:D-Ala-D-Ala carboxypeptidase family metallohydrolase [Phocaeicola barnesiae]